MRALTHPYPGAFADVNGHRLTFWRTTRNAPPSGAAPSLRVEADAFILTAADGAALGVEQLDIDGQVADRVAFVHAFGSGPVQLA
mgnify:CR=1 FL=1